MAVTQNAHVAVRTDTEVNQKTFPMMSSPLLLIRQLVVRRSSSALSSFPRSFHASTVSLDSNNTWHGTTIVCIRKNGRVVMMGDGQVTMGSMTVKPNAKKIRRIPSKDKEEGSETLVGFAGSTADAFTLLERLEGKLEEYPGQLARSCVELAKGWRTDKYLRRLEASLLVADETISLELTGNGDVLESNDGVLGVGSGSPYALAAARALMDLPDLTAEQVAEKAMNIASDMCVYTNKEFMVESMATKEKDQDEK
jgi:ATP-dependent HslUV protease subunit HslV